VLQAGLVILEMQVLGVLGVEELLHCLLLPLAAVVTQTIPASMAAMVALEVAELPAAITVVSEVARALLVMLVVQVVRVVPALLATPLPVCRRRLTGAMVAPLAMAVPEV
jgi:hypothetical protein